MTGLFELLNPPLALLDGVMGGLAPAARLLIWGALAGMGSMALYAAISPQARLKRLAEDARAALRSLRSQDVQSAAYRDEMLGSLRTSLRRAGITLVPALLSSLPVLFVIGYVNANYSLSEPVPGEPVAVLVDDARSITIEGGQRFTAGWTVPWPKGDATVRVFDRAGQPIYSLTGDTQPGTARKSGLLAFLVGAQAGLIAPGSSVESLEIETTPRPIVQPGLSLHLQWVIPFVLGLLLASLLMKVVFRIS
jgi:hypothetical protein